MYVQVCFTAVVWRCGVGGRREEGRVCHVHHVHVFILLSDLYPPSPVSVDGGGEEWDSWSGPERVRVCV